MIRRRFHFSLPVVLAMLLLGAGRCGAQTETRWVTSDLQDGSSQDQAKELGMSAAKWLLDKPAPPEPRHVLGNDACVKCHPSETAVWQSTPHAKTFQTLHRKPEAGEIARRLGLNSIKHSGRCSSCHYTQQADASGQPEGDAPVGTAHAIAGVSCESCHGAASRWVEIHHDYGGPTLTRLTESSEHRQQRIRKSIAAGMRNPSNLYLVAQSCLRCHTTNDEALVNVGGHVVGSPDFEFVSWSQGTVRHNFLRSEGKTNETRPPETLRVMFVVGMIAELEATLRATASATEKATFGLTSAKRADRAAKRLASIAAKVDVPQVKRILGVYQGITLKLNNETQLVDAANQIATIGFEFAANADGSTLSALDPYLPSARK